MYVSSMAMCFPFYKKHKRLLKVNRVRAFTATDLMTTCFYGNWPWLSVLLGAGLVLAEGTHGSGDVPRWNGERSIVDNMS